MTIRQKEPSNTKIAICHSFKYNDTTISKVMYLKTISKLFLLWRFTLPVKLLKLLFCFNMVNMFKKKKMFKWKNEEIKPVLDLNSTEFN